MRTAGVPLTVISIRAVMIGYVQQHAPSTRPIYSSSGSPMDLIVNTKTSSGLALQNRRGRGMNKRNGSMVNCYQAVQEDEPSNEIRRA